MPRRTLWILTARVLAVHWLVLQGVPWRGTALLRQRQGVHHPQRGSAAACGSGSPAPSPSPAAAPSAAAPPPKPAKPRKVAPVRPAATEPAPAPVSPPTWPQRNQVATEPTGNTEQGRTAPPHFGCRSACARGFRSGGCSTSGGCQRPAPSPVADGSGVDITPPGGTPGQGTSTAAPVRLPAPIKLAFDVAGKPKV